MNDRISKPVKRKYLDSDDSSDDGTSLELGNRSSSADISSDSFLYEDENSFSPPSYTESDSSAVFVTSSPSTASSKSKSSAKSKKNSVKNIPSDSSSESGDENCEKCAICLRSITSQEVGNPEVCDHIFCSVCIIEWSKNSNVCPLDRQQFSIILVRENKTGTVVRKVTIGEEGGRQQGGQQFWQMIQAEYVDDTVCEICGLGDREDIMLLCDLCDRGFHTVCLTPPLNNLPDENEWYCPDCTTLSPNEETTLELPSHSSRTLRPRFSMVRTRLLERIRMTVNRIVENYVLRQSDSAAPSISNSNDSDSESSESSFLDVVDIDQPSTSGLQRRRQFSRKTAKGKKATLETRKRTNKTSKTNGRRKRKRKSTTTASTRTRKRKTTTGGKRKTTTRRRTKVKTTRTKKVKVENEDGSVTEKIVKTRTYKRRRQKTRKRKAKTTSIGIRRGLRVKSKTTPKTVKGRLTLKLKMMPPNKPGQLLPDVKVKPPNSHLSLIDLNRARAGIPKLHIFGPRDELQYYSSESDHEGFAESGSGGVLSATQTRTNLSRIQNRKKAVLLLQSRSSTTRATSKPKPVIESPPECVDILGSILDSQAIWHSKKTNVKINDDGSIEVIKDDNKEVNDAPKPKSNNKTVDMREKSPEGVITQAPMYPGSGSRPGGFRSYNRNNYGDSRSRQDNMFGPRGGPGQAGTNFNRFGGPARNDREGYANYLNNMPQGPTPFCRGGPPLRFRMPPRQQLRRIPFPPRNRPAWNPGEESDDGNSIGKEEKKTEEEEQEEQREGRKKDKTESKQQEEDEDIDLYSDIESSMDKADNSGAEDTATTYPALGPPPEPSPFLLGLNESEDLGVDNKDKSEVYDPAEPCDSDEELVIDENREQAPISEKKEPEVTNKESDLVSAPPKTATNTDAVNVTKSTSQKCSSEDDDDEDCPIFSIYSSATRAFSEKEEEERQREIAEDRRRLEEAKKKEEQKSKTDSEPPTDEQEPEKNLKPEVTKEEEEEEPIKEDAEGQPQEKAQARRLSFHIDEDVDTKSDYKSPAREDSSGSSELAKEKSRSPSVSPTAVKNKEKRKSPSFESDRETTSMRLRRSREKSSSTDGASEKFRRSARKKRYDSDSGEDAEKSDHDRKSDDDKENDETGERVIRGREDDRTPEKELESENDTVLSPQRVAAGLEGLDVEEVSSDNEGDEFADRRSLSSLSLSDLSDKSKKSMDSDQSKKKRKNRKKKIGKPKSDRSRDDDEREDRLKESKNENDEIRNENSLKAKERRKGRKSGSEGLERQVLGSRENKKSTDKSKDKDLSWKKPSKKDRNYREGKKKSKERGRSKSNERRKSRSPTPKKDKRKNKERKKKAGKKKDMERYDVRKVVKNKEVRKTDAFGRDIISKSRSISRSRSRSPIRERSRNMLRRDSRSFSRSRSRSFRRGRSPVRRRYVRSRTRSRSKSIARRSYSRSRSPSRSRKTKKKPKSKDRLKIRSRSRGRKSRSCSRGGGRRRSMTRSRSRSPVQRVMRSKKTRSRRRSWSHHESRTPSFSPRRSRSITRSPIRVGRTYSRSVSRSWSRGRSPLPRASSLEKLTVILTTKDKKKWKKKKDGKKIRKEEKKKKKAAGNSKEVFASGDNVLVSVNFRNNNSSNANDSSSVTNNDRNTRLNSVSPGPALETSSRKRKKGSDYENEKITKKSKKSGVISKKVVDVALSNSCPKRAKKLTRLSEKDAEVILNRKPVAVIDLDMSPYREQTPSPVNVVVVSDSGSGDEGKERSPQRANVRGTPNVETEKVEENVGGPSVDASTTNSPVENGYVPTLGPKTPPEPQIKFSINKPQQLRPIANPLGDDDDDEEEEEEEDREDERDGGEVEERLESLDIRIEKELNQRSEISHKGPNTPPTPRGPSTPKSPPSPQSSPDAYDPFEPTKSRSPTPSQDDKENHPTSKTDVKEDETSESVQGEGLTAVVPNTMTEDSNKTASVVPEIQEGKTESSDKSEPGPTVECSPTNVAAPSSGASASVSDSSPKESPERKIGVISTPQTKSQTPTLQKTFSPVLKQVPMVSSSATVQPTSVSMAVSTDMFALSSPTKTRTSTSTTTATTQTLQVSGIQRLQHRLGSPVNRTPNSVKSTPEKRTTPRPESNNEILSSGNYMIRNVSKRNGEQPKQTRPLQDATNETIDVGLEMDDSPYSPASSEGDDLFDPPPDVSKPSQSNSKATPSHKALPKAHHKSPTKQLSKFDLLFGVGGPTLSPLKVGTKKTNTKLPGKPLALPKLIPPKPQKKGTSKRNVNKMDEDQLRILDELPSSAVELQVKDKFLKKLNRQERVVDEVKTVLKPHYARKHITKEEYKDILRRSVPKICHSRSGEINPSKIQSLIEAYVRKFRHAKKKGMNTVPKPKAKKTMFS